MGDVVARFRGCWGCRLSNGRGHLDRSAGRFDDGGGGGRCRGGRCGGGCLFGGKFERLSGRGD
ncbi:MAG TPA: hypothetical protein PLX31_23800, partial [Gemmatimonadaceae bacterium]|nr:hypothetical protein [Gemmatimonadaceae bacterium]